MATKISFDESVTSGANIKVIGVGGGGGNALNTMIDSGLQGVQFVAMNTDQQALRANRAHVKLQLGSRLTKGLGAGANPQVGHDAALEDESRISELIAGADMCFVTAGLGGGTGTGAAPIIANIVRAQNALTVAVVTKPFDFEGPKRRKQAEKGLEELQKVVDTLIVVPNQKLLELAEPNLALGEAFRRADSVLLQAVRGISDLVNLPGYINVDFADVRTIMCNKGVALMGTGEAEGEDRALRAANLAIESPLLDNVSINGASGILLNITSSSRVKLAEVRAAADLIGENAHEDVNLIYGQVVDETMGDRMKITVIATGFESPASEARSRRRRSAQQLSMIEEFHAPPQSVPAPRHDSSVHEYHNRERILHNLHGPQLTAPGTPLGGDDFDIPTFIRRQLNKPNRNG